MTKSAKSTEKELRPCPFCGGNRLRLWESQCGAAVGCEIRRCRIVGPRMRTRAKAIAAWNRRAGNEETKQ